MAGTHTVEKIGGTSMSRFGELLQNVIIGDRKGDDLYGRIFVVSAYGGITNLLLENKKSGEPGVYGLFAAGGDSGWRAALDALSEEMLACNRRFESIGLDRELADRFVEERIHGVRDCLQNLNRVRSYGHIQAEDFLPATREFLSAQGEAHSAFNSVAILRAHGVNARLVDLTGWKAVEVLPLDETIRRAFADVDVARELPVVTGYVKCSEGIMTRFSRGYSEITFSKVAVITGAREGVIHKEFHLCTGDPKLVGVDKARIIGNTNFDIADQMSDMDMEAIHAKASMEMQQRNIPIRVKNAFDPHHPGTLISRDYVSAEPRVDMICGRCDLLAVDVYDSDMVGEVGYDLRLVQALKDLGVSYVAKSTNANTITHFVPEGDVGRERLLAVMKACAPNARIDVDPVAIISAVGTNMKIPGLLSIAATALAAVGINILAVDQSMRQVNMQFVVERADFVKAQVALHDAFIAQRGESAPA